MKIDTNTSTFLETLLFCADNPDEENRPFEDSTIYDFTPEFISAASTYLETLWERMTASPDIAAALDACERSFGGNAFFSGSGHGAGFFDEYPHDGDALQASYDAISGRYRFEELETTIHLDLDTGKIDLAYLPEYVDERRAAIFTLPATV